MADSNQSDVPIDPYDGTKGFHVGRAQWVRKGTYRGRCFDCAWRGPERDIRPDASRDLQRHADEVADAWIRAGRPGMGDRS